jgi:malate dehydrogenase (oxaloacetate-decarboxylating)
VEKERIKISLSPETILNLPLVNKGTAFTQEERDLLGLNGFLPTHILTAEEQIARTHQNLHAQRTPLEKYVFLMGILNRNELLFYQFVSKYATEILPIIYTPTVGEAAIHYSQIYFRQRGLYLSYPLMNKMDEILAHYPHQDIQVIVVTDGERILGLGDQGIGGITIPVGKLSIYTLFGGIHPAKTLPILLDVGTNNPALLNNEFYLGWRHERLVGEEYNKFIDLFVHAVKKRFPKVLLQWEDFGQTNARPILDLYRKKLLSFNDDIQGTAYVSLGAILSVLHGKKEKLSEQKIAILGAGSAGTGIADALVFAMQNEGLSKDAAIERIFLVDRNGLLNEEMQGLFPSQKPYAKQVKTLAKWTVANPQFISMKEVVHNAHPTVLIGVSGQPGAFTQEIIEEMARFAKEPIIFPLSNPTSKAEATPTEILNWTKGKAIVATGSPFTPVEYENKIYNIGQCNNVYIFPGLGTGALAAEAREITDGMFLCASYILASLSPYKGDSTASIFPPIADVRKISREIALGVAKKAIEEGVSSIPISEVEKKVSAIMWEPHYPTYTK